MKIYFGVEGLNSALVTVSDFILPILFMGIHVWQSLIV